MSVLHEAHEQEKASLTKHLQSEQESSDKTHQEEIRALKAKYEKSLLEMEGSMHELRNSNNMVGNKSFCSFCSFKGFWDAWKINKPHALYMV